MAWLLRQGEVLASLDFDATLASRARRRASGEGPVGALLVPSRRLVHTIGARGPLDVAYLDADLVVLATSRIARTASRWLAGAPRPSSRPRAVPSIAGGCAPATGWRSRSEPADPVAGRLRRRRPIGNLGDLSARAVATLAEADVVACEDTRHTGRLLAAAGMRRQAAPLAPRPQRGRADGRGARPCSRWARSWRSSPTPERRSSRIPATGSSPRRRPRAPGRPVPGPSALLAALVVSGLDPSRWRFEGFLPRKGAEREERLARLAASARDERRLRVARPRRPHPGGPRRRLRPGPPGGRGARADEAPRGGVAGRSRRGARARRAGRGPGRARPRPRGRVRPRRPPVTSSCRRGRPAGRGRALPAAAAGRGLGPPRGEPPGGLCRLARRRSSPGALAAPASAPGPRRRGRYAEAVVARYYQTTPIYYVNDRPHLGTAYTTVTADALARWHRLAGDEVLLPHRDRRARPEDRRGGRGARACPRRPGPTRRASWFREAWAALGITNDDFIRTTEPRHRRAVQRFVQAIYDNGFIYKGSTRAGTASCARPTTPRTSSPRAAGARSTDAGGVAGRGELLLRASPPSPTGSSSGTTANPAGGLARDEAQRGAWLHPPGPRGHLDLPDLHRLGDPGPLGPGARRLRLVRRADQLRTAVGYGSDDERFDDVVAGGPPPHRQGHLALPLRVVAGDVHGGRHRPADRAHRPRLLARRRGEDVEVAARTRSTRSSLAEDVGVDALRYHLLRDVTLGSDGDFSYEGLIARYNADLANNLGNLLAAGGDASSARSAAAWARRRAGRARAPAGERRRRGAWRRARAAWSAVAPPTTRSSATWRLIRETNAELEEHRAVEARARDPRSTGCSATPSRRSGSWRSSPRPRSPLAAPGSGGGSASRGRRTTPGLAAAEGASLEWGGYPGGLAVEKGEPALPPAARPRGRSRRSDRRPRGPDLREAWTDTHCHLQDGYLAEPAGSPRSSPARRAPGVARAICVGTDLDSSRRATELAARWTGGSRPRTAPRGPLVDGRAAPPRRRPGGRAPGGAARDPAAGLRRSASGTRASRSASAASTTTTTTRPGRSSGPPSPSRSPLARALEPRARRPHERRLGRHPRPPPARARPRADDHPLLHRRAGRGAACLDLGAYLSFSGIVTFKKARRGPRGGAPLPGRPAPRRDRRARSSPRCRTGAGRTSPPTSRWSARRSRRCRDARRRPSPTRHRERRRRLRPPPA